MADREAVKQLLQKYLNGTCNESEQAIVEAWYQEQVQQHSWEFSASDDPQLGERIFARLKERLNLREKVRADKPTAPFSPVKHTAPARPATLVHIRRHWTKYAAALLLLIGAKFWLGQDHSQNHATQAAAQTNDIAPGTNKAILTLANGKKISLDSNAAGLIALQGNTTIVQTGNGKLEFNAPDPAGPTAQNPNAANPNVSTAKANIVYNSLSTPIGGQYQLRLPDGSKVWLNALTTIRFPSIFTGTSREVEVNGEAYFEIEKDEQHPFHVIARDVNIEVLGTAFNINSYEDEPAIRTSLLQGAVSVSRGNSRVTLHPGEQAQTINPAELSKVNDADVEKAIAWKNGSFSFDNDNIQTIMRQLSKWYDIDVRYQGEPPHTIFGGNMRRTLSLKQVLAGLSKYDVHFRLEGRTLFVMP